MDKILNFNGEQLKAEKIIKTDTDIIGQDANGNEVFAFRTISDFTEFTVANEGGTDADYDSSEPSITDLQTQIYNLTSLLVSGGVI